jgi:hypothetical protein
MNMPGFNADGSLHKASKVATLACGALLTTLSMSNPRLRIARWSNVPVCESILGRSCHQYNADGTRRRGVDRVCSAALTKGSSDSYSFQLALEL